LENWLLPALAACAVSLVLSVASIIWVVLFSTPALFRKCVEHSLVMAKDAHAKAEEIESKFLIHKTEMSGLYEAVEGVLDSVEKKRRQTSAAASRVALVQDGPIEAQTREQIIAGARAKVYGAG